MNRHKPSIFSLLATIWSQLAGNRGWLLIGLLLVAITVCFIVGLPLYYRTMLDEAVVKSDQQLLYLMLLWLGIAYLVNSSAAVLQSRVFARLSAFVVSKLRRNMFFAVQQLGDRGTSSSASIANHFGSDLTAVEKWLAQPARVMLIHGSVLVTSALLLFWIEWRLALFTYSIIPVIAVAMKLLSKPTQTYSAQKKESESGIATFVSEEVRSGTMIRLFGLQQRRSEQFSNQCNNMQHLETKVAFWSSVTGETSIILVNLIQIGIFGLGAYFTIAGYITLGTLIAYAGLMINISNAGITLSQLFPQLFDAASAHGRISNLLQESGKPITTGGNQQFAQLQQITMRDLSFGYTPQSTVLRQITLTLQHGEHVAIVGSSGSGKSTLLRLIMGLEQNRDGSLEFNNIPIQQLDIAHLHQHMAPVFQQALLLDCSIADNIRVGKENATLEEVKRAAEKAEIATVIEKMEHGYDTIIGESGGNLSGGQQQRIAIARALIRDPQLLILDEATSALDATTELAIIEMLQHNSDNRTVIAVTHRLALATAMDRIIVLHNGEVAEDGSHEELLAKNGLYAELWSKQHITHQTENGAVAINLQQLLHLPPIAALQLPQYLDPNALQSFSQQFVEEHFVAKQLIIEEGKEPDAFRIIVRGRVEVFHATDTDRVIAVLEEGDYFGEGALLHDTTRVASVRALDDTVCLALSAVDFKRIVSQHEPLHTALESVFAQRLTANKA